MDSSGKPLEKYTEGGTENGKAVELCGEQEAARGCCSSPAWTRLLPPEYRTELRELFKLAGPVVSARPPGNLSLVSSLWGRVKLPAWASSRV